MYFQNAEASYKYVLNEDIGNRGNYFVSLTLYVCSEVGAVVVFWSVVYVYFWSHKEIGSKMIFTAVR